MSILNKTITKKILDHAEREYPLESCGLIVKIGGYKKYIPCTNSIGEGNSEEDFRISAEEYAYAEDQGEILAVVHSHPDHTTQPSVRDRASCSAMEIPWVIVSYPEKDIRIITPEKAPLEGRQFCHGTDWDCYGLIRDYYQEILGISLNRYHHDSFWWEEGHNYYVDNFENEGFFKVDDGSLLPHDVLLMQIRSAVPNHGAIYLGDGKIIHHPFGKLSKKDIYGGYWQEKTVMVLRNREVVERFKNR